MLYVLFLLLIRFFTVLDINKSHSTTDGHSWSGNRQLYQLCKLAHWAEMGFALRQLCAPSNGHLTWPPTLVAVQALPLPVVGYCVIVTLQAIWIHRGMPFYTGELVEHPEASPTKEE